MRIEILREAHEDIRDGRRFYEAQEQGVGQYFVRTIYSDIRSLCNFAGIHPRRHGHFMMLVRRFPYAVYYDRFGDRVVVVAVLDCRRDPLRIAMRLGVLEELT